MEAINFVKNAILILLYQKQIVLDMQNVILALKTGNGIQAMIDAYAMKTKRIVRLEAKCTFGIN